KLRWRRARRMRATIARIGRSPTVSNKRSGRRIMCQMNTVAMANFENRAIDSACAKRWVSSQITPANWARAKIATVMRAKVGLAIRAEAAHHRMSRANMVPIKARTNRMLKDRTKEPKKLGAGSKDGRMVAPSELLSSQNGKAYEHHRARASA